ncbi:MAG: TrkA family potassium uptake protein [Bacilli bacterium]
MRAVIAGGTHEADYIVSLFKKNGYDIIVINNDPIWAKYISKKNSIDVFQGDQTKLFVLEEAEIHDADVFLALSSNDIDNYVACIMAKHVFKVTKVVCTVVNPKNVELFRELGIEGVVSSTYLLANKVFIESSIDEMQKVLSIENDKIVISEIEVAPNTRLDQEYLKNIKFPVDATISCIYRDPDVIIPFGGTLIKSGDKIVVVTIKENLDKVTDFINTDK